VYKKEGDASEHAGINAVACQGLTPFYGLVNKLAAYTGVRAVRFSYRYNLFLAVS
jgi:hypothetical protein